MLAEHLFSRLQELYDQVPSTRCANSGECCALTQAEYDGDYATMFPLYRVEFENILRYVKTHFDTETRNRLLSHTTERPKSCPFLDGEHNCTIYPVRPLICRTYAVMNVETIAHAAEINKGSIAQDWIDGFVLRESGMVCPRVTVTEPEKMERHARNLIDSSYEKSLTELSRQVTLEKERLKLFRRVSLRRNWPLRWTWGGFNALRIAPMEWLRKSFGAYWKSNELADAR